MPAFHAEGKYFTITATTQHKEFPLKEGSHELAWNLNLRPVFWIDANSVDDTAFLFSSWIGILW